MSTIWRRFEYWLHRDRADKELAEEMEFHRAMLAAGGASAAAMGNTTLAREQARAVWIWPWLESVWQDAVYALRVMRRDKAFTLTALAALGLAIGLNTSLFTIFNAIALRPWPVRDPAHVVTAHRLMREGGAAFGIAEYRYFASHSRAFSGLTAIRNGDEARLFGRAVGITYVSGNYFRVLGVGMERGRGFLGEEDRSGAPEGVAVISHDLWQERFGGDPEIVGRRIRLDEIPLTIVGVTSAEFTGTNPLRNDVWVPLAARKLMRPNDPSVETWLSGPDQCCTPMAGRLAPGVTRQQAAAELELLLEQFRKANGLSAQQARVQLAGTAWIDSPRKKKQVVPTMILLFLAVTLVLLLACANVGNLLLARAAARRREIAVRLSLGGGRLRIVRQLLVESMLLALAASVLGLAMAMVVPAAVLRKLAEGEVFHAVPDFNVLAYTVAVAVLSCLAFGLAPALHGTRAGISAALKSGAETMGGRLRLRSVLLALQVAISVILLVSAGVLVRAMQRAQSIDPGVDVRRVTVLSLDLPASEYAGPRTRALTRDLQAALDQAPDLPARGLVLNPPFANATYLTSFRPAGSRMLTIFSNEVSGGYFAAVGMRLVAGRVFTTEDSGRDVIIVDEEAVRRWWKGQYPVGQDVFANGKMRRIVGVASDTYANDLSSVETVLYFPITGGSGTPRLVVRDRRAATLGRVAAMVKQLEPRAQVRAEALSAIFAQRLEPAVRGAEFAGFLGLLALAIASIGMSGVFMYVVGQRTREIGVRMALGARPAQIVRLVLGSTLRALVGGLAAGAAIAAGISAVLAHALPGIHAVEPLALCAVVLLLSVAVGLASAVPARRATRVDPVRALRWE